ncbi:uncharacterized protein LOC132107634 [Carassius carassius]|uniref:uncharacterized protein LOC132107634 n=1 Tax=Carassius carassius TaxID=217509 RepID=UPI002868EA21|nr:uncharacterized protein LOC132107634 [Carassius carassius]
MRFMLIQWIEDPPKWDVLPTNKMIHGRCEIGCICDVSYQDESTPAKILNIGTRSAMLKQLNMVINRMGPEGNGEQLGRGQRKKYRRILSESSSSEEYEPVNKQVAAKNINRIRARSFLQQYNQEKESNREAVTSRNSDSEFNVQILAELAEIKSALLETLTLLKNGCTPLMTAPIPTLGTPPGPTSDLIPGSSESSAVIPAPSSSLQTLNIKESRSNGNCKKVRIGPNMSITAEQFAHVKWTDHKKATKDLLLAVFGRGVLATHCYTGRCSNAFKNKAAKPQLDSEKVSDIISYIKNKFNVEANVNKKAISQKCTDECKLAKRHNSDCV